MRRSFARVPRRPGVRRSRWSRRWRRPPPAQAQRGAVDGHASIGVDHLPNLEDTTELRARLFVERGWTPGPWRIRGAVLVEGLAADRDRTRHDGHLQVREATVGWSGGAFDVRAGIGTIVWGRLDEVQPTDVINPLDASKYLLEGRAEARLPVAHAPRALVRRREGDGRSGVGAAVHARPLRRARRGQLAVQPPRRRRALHAVAGLSAGGAVHPPRAGAVAADVARRRPPERHQRPGGLGARRLQRVSGLRPHLGRADRPAARHAARFHPAGPRLRDLPAVHDDRRRRGNGARRLGDSRRDGGHDRRHRRDRHVAARASTDTASAPASAPIARPAPFASTAPSWSSAASRTRSRSLGIAGGADTNVSLVVGGDRGFARDTRKVRVFGAWNVADSSGFARTIGTWSLRDNLSLVGSVGWFFGAGRRRHLPLRRARFRHGVAEDLLLASAAAELLSGCSVTECDARRRRVVMDTSPPRQRGNSAQRAGRRHVPIPLLPPCQPGRQPAARHCLRRRPRMRPPRKAPRRGCSNAP